MDANQAGMVDDRRKRRRKRAAVAVLLLLTLCMPFAVCHWPRALSALEVDQFDHSRAGAPCCQLCWQRGPTWQTLATHAEKLGSLCLAQSTRCPWRNKMAEIGEPTPRHTGTLTNSINVEPPRKWTQPAIASWMATTEPRTCLSSEPPCQCAPTSKTSNNLHFELAAQSTWGNSRAEQGRVEIQHPGLLCTKSGPLDEHYKNNTLNTFPAITLGNLGEVSWGIAAEQAESKQQHSTAISLAFVLLWTLSYMLARGCARQPPPTPMLATLNRHAGSKSTRLKSAVPVVRAMHLHDRQHDNRSCLIHAINNLLGKRLLTPAIIHAEWERVCQLLHRESPASVPTWATYLTANSIDYGLLNHCLKVTTCSPLPAVPHVQLTACSFPGGLPQHDALNAIPSESRHIGFILIQGGHARTVKHANSRWWLHDSNAPRAIPLTNADTVQPGYYRWTDLGRGLALTLTYQRHPEISTDFNIRDIPTIKPPTTRVTLSHEGIRLTPVRTATSTRPQAGTKRKHDPDGHTVGQPTATTTNPLPAALPHKNSNTP